MRAAQGPACIDTASRGAPYDPTGSRACRRSSRSGSRPPSTAPSPACLTCLVATWRKTSLIPASGCAMVGSSERPAARCRGWYELQSALATRTAAARSTIIRRQDTDHGRSAERDRHLPLHHHRRQQHALGAALPGYARRPGAPRRLTQRRHRPPMASSSPRGEGNSFFVRTRTPQARTPLFASGGPVA